MINVLFEFQTFVYIMLSAQNVCVLTNYFRQRRILFNFQVCDFFFMLITQECNYLYRKIPRKIQIKESTIWFLTKTNIKTVGMVKLDILMSNFLKKTSM